MSNGIVDLGGLYASAMFPQPYATRTETNTDIAALNLSSRVQYKLQRVGIYTLAHLLNADPVTFWGMRYFGDSGRAELRTRVPQLRMGSDINIRQCCLLGLQLKTPMYARHSYPLRGRVEEFLAGGR